jgi:hypothetical protein
MAIEVTDVLRIAVAFLFDDLYDIVNVWHIVPASLGTAGTDTAVMEDIADAMITWYELGLGLIVDNIAGNSLSGVNLTKDELLPVVPFEFESTNAADGLPLTNAPLISWGTSTPRHGSRIYLPGCVESHQNDGLMDSAVLSALASMAASVLVGQTGSLDGVAFNRVAYDRTANYFRTLTSAFVPTELRTQRRRRRGVGS